MNNLERAPKPDLPSWMVHSQESFDWGMIIVVAFCLFSAWPLIAQSTLPDTNNNVHHVFRTAETAMAIQEGRLFPRWSSFAQDGIGSPISHFYPPGATHFAAVIEILLTANTILAVRFTYIIARIVSGLTVYLFLRKYGGIPAGIVSALLYVYCPYLSFTLPHVLGNLPDALALALLPALIWAVDRAISRIHFTDRLGIAAITAALILTAPLYLVAALVYCTVLCLVSGKLDRISNVIGILGAALGGVGLTAFYWLPALVEYDKMIWVIPILNLPDLPLSIAGLFEPTRMLQATVMIQNAQFNLGFPLLGLTIISFVIMLIDPQPIFAAFTIIAVVLISFSLLLGQTAIWLFGASMLGLAIGTSTILNAKFMVRFQKVLFTVFIYLIVWYAVPALFIEPPQIPIEDTMAEAQMAYERSNTAIAALPLGASIPNTANPDQWVELGPVQFDREGYLDRIANNNPAVAQFTLLQQDTHRARYQVFTSSGSTILYKQMYFPGWMASLDNQRSIPLYQDQLTGLTRIDLPPNTNGILEISLGGTPLRTAAWVVSMISLGLIVLATTLSWSKWQQEDNWYTSAGRFEIGVTTSLLAVLAVIVVIPQIRTSITASSDDTPDRLRDVIYTYNRTNSNLRLLGYEIKPDEQSLNEVTVHLYWDIIEQSDELYRVKINVRSSANNQIVATSGIREPGFYSTDRWEPGLYIEDTYSLDLGNNVRAGQYFVDIQGFICTPDCSQGIFFIKSVTQPAQQDLTLPTPIVLE